MVKQKKFWFKAKNYGWGWYPATWQGWSILLFYLFLVITNYRHVNSVTNSVNGSLLSIVPETFILTILLIIICHATGEKPEWRWGGKTKKR
jgi:hypothetical protein